MSETLEQLGADYATSDLPYAISLELTVEDRDVIAELIKHREGIDRDEFALEALKIGVLTLRRASASFDGEFIKRETDRLLSTLRDQLKVHADSAKEKIENSLGQYFHPESGHFSQRVKQLTSADGELDRVIRTLVDGEDSRLAKTMLSQIGENSPLMKQLSPDQSQGLLSVLRTTVEMQLSAQRDRLLKEFSLDNSEGALCRLVQEITTKHGDFTSNMKTKIDDVVKEFSLDQENSALSRLVKKVNAAQETITEQFSLDNDQSSLKRMQTHLETILGAHIKSAADFQEEVKVALGKLVTKREVEARGTQHGATFEDALFEFLAAECQPRGEVIDNTTGRVGLIRNCKIGDAVVELGCDSAAAGAKIVIEAKEDAKYTLAKAREEIEQARKNRNAQYGIFVFSHRTAPQRCEPLKRIGNDLFVLWNAEELATDFNLRAALEIARALCIRNQQAKQKQTVDFTVIDRSILEIEKRVKNLDIVAKSAESIKTASNDILDRVRIDREALDKQIVVLRDCVDDLKTSFESQQADSE
jgi:hypothetical protein